MTKHFFYSIILISLYSCNVINRKLERETQSSPIARQDSVDISLTPGVQYKMHKDQYKAILAVRTEFFSDAPVDPDSTYYTALDSLEDFVFASETGQDYYYLWYTYFLKSRYAYQDFEAERLKLRELYGSINKIYSVIAMGGTYFSHSIPRIEAYVEWDIYRHHILETLGFLNQPDFNEAKERFLRKNQCILDSLNSSKYWTGKTDSEKADLVNELKDMFIQLASKIDNSFYLNQVIHFEERYSHLVVNDCTKPSF